MKYTLFKFDNTTENFTQIKILIKDEYSNQFVHPHPYLSTCIYSSAVTKIKYQFNSSLSLVTNFDMILLYFLLKR